MNQVKTDRKTQIGEAILDIAGSDGLQGLTTARIAAEVGFTEAALYRYFKNKEDILAFVLDTQYGMIEESRAEIEAAGGTGIGKLESVLRRILALFDERPGLYRIIYSDELHRGSPLLMMKLSRLGLALLEIMEGYIEEARAEGLVRPDADPRALALAVFGCMHSAFGARSILGIEGSLVERGMDIFRITMLGVESHGGKGIGDNNSA